VAESSLRLVLVTPETTLVDAEVGSLQFPLYDGQAGVLPGRAPVTLLTDRAQGLDEIDRQAAEELLAESSKRVPTTDAELAAKERDQECARRMLAVTG
jgi:F-type H+-transporting ATPase subunit epsilon